MSSPMNSAASSFQSSQVSSFFEKHHYLILLLTLSIAFFIRVYGLAEDPPGMYMDEVSSAYNAYSILHTGKDEHGKTFPLFFEAFGEYRQGLYIYSMIPSLFIFGLTDFGTRFTSVLFGMGSLILFYFISRKLFHPNFSLIATALLSIQPWHFFLSRVAFEGISFVFLFLAGLIFFLKAIEQKIDQNKTTENNTIEKKIWQNKQALFLFIAVLFFALSTYSYGVAKLFVPIFLLGLTGIYHDFFFSHSNKKILYLSLLFFLLVSFPLYYLSFFGEGNTRFEQGSVFSLSDHPVFTLLFNYISHYTPSFLFFEADADLRHHLDNRGVLYPIEIFFIFFGLLSCFKTRKEKRTQLLFLWLFLFALPASFMAGDTPHVLRTFIGAPLFALLCTQGIFFLWECIKSPHISALLLQKFLQKNSLNKQKVFIIFSLLIFLSYALSAAFFFHEYFTSYKIYSSDYWMSYAKPLMEYVEAHHQEYDHIYFSSVSFGRFGVYILYSIQADPQQYLDSQLASFGYELCNMDINESCITEDEHNLYIFRAIETPTINGTYNIYYPDNKTIAVKLFSGGR